MTTMTEKKLNDTAQRILDGIADADQRRVAEIMVRGAKQMLTAGCDEDTARRIMNAVGAQWTR